MGGPDLQRNITIRSREQGVQRGRFEINTHSAYLFPIADLMHSFNAMEFPVERSQPVYLRPDQRKSVSQTISPPTGLDVQEGFRGNEGK